APGLHWILRDITQRRLAEGTLRAEKEFADNLVDLAEGVVLLLDGADRIVRTNRFTCSLIGQELGELSGRSMVDLLVPEDRESAREVLSQLGAGAPKVGSVHGFQTKDGRLRMIVWSARGLTAGGDRNRWTLVVGNDITDLQEAQQRALQAE